MNSISNAAAFLALCQVLFLSAASAADLSSSFEAHPECGKVELVWGNQDPAKLSGYMLEKSSDGLNYITIVKGSTSGENIDKIVQSVVDPDFMPNTYYRLSLSENKTIIIQHTLLVRQENSGPNLELLTVYPNPAQSGNQINLRLKNVPTRQDVSIMLINMLGKKVFSMWIDSSDTNKLNSFKLPSDMKQGSYFLIASSRDGLYKYTRKLVIREKSNF